MSSVKKEARRAQARMASGSPTAAAPSLTPKKPIETTPRYRRAWNDAGKATFTWVGIGALVVFGGTPLALNVIQPDGMCPDDPDACMEVYIDATGEPGGTGASNKRLPLEKTTTPTTLHEGSRYSFAVCKGMVYIEPDGDTISNPIVGYDPDNEQVGLLPRPVTFGENNVQVDVAQYQPGGYYKEADGTAVYNATPTGTSCAETYVTAHKFREMGGYPVKEVFGLVIEGEEAYTDQPLAKLAEQMPSVFASYHTSASK